MGRDRETYYFDEPSATAARVPACGHTPSRSFPTGCTRAAGHEGEHGYPNWDGHLEVEVYRGFALTKVNVDTRNDHGGSSVSLRSREAADRFIKAIEEARDQAWPEGSDDFGVVI